MTKENNTPKIVFAPGAFDAFEGTQEELNEMVAEIHKMFGELTIDEIKEQSREITEEEFQELPEDVQVQIARSMLEEHGEDLDQEFKRKLQ
jgi:Mg/Co/Ni transporter MgtE